MRDSRPFRAKLTIRPAGRAEHAEAIEVHDGYVACFAPQHPEFPHDAELELERFGMVAETLRAPVRFLRAAPSFCSTVAGPPADALVLLTNGRGGMARLRVDLGTVKSKYDCALGANLNPEFPGGPPRPGQTHPRLD